MLNLEELHGKVLNKMDLTKEPADEELQDLIYEVLEEQSQIQFIPLDEKAALGKEMFNALRKLDILQELVEDKSITEIMINGIENIFIEKNGQIEISEKRFISRGKLEDVIQQMAAECNRIVNEASPIVDVRLKDGSRVNIVLPPVALNGPIVTIRKFPEERINMERLIEYGSLSREVSEFLILIVRARYNVFISGGTSSGKTTFLNALSDYIPKDERIITIEDNAELQITTLPNLVRLEARNANLEGEGEVTIRQLIKAALRMRPDRIIVGEVRGDEAIDMLQAFNTGHDGSISTGHANSPQDMLNRLEMMVLMGMEIPLSAVRRQIASGIDILIHLGRLRDNSRKVLKIMEVLEYDQEGIILQPLFTFQEIGEENGKVKGKWLKHKELEHTEKLLASGNLSEREIDGNGKKYMPADTDCDVVLCGY